MTKVIELNNNNAQAYFIRGRAYQKLNKTKPAMDNYNTAINYNPNLGGPYMYRGMLKIHTNRKKAGCSDLKKAKSLNEPNADKLLKKYCK